MEERKKSTLPAVAGDLPTTISVTIGDRGGSGKSCQMALQPPASCEPPRFWARMASSRDPPSSRSNDRNHGPKSARSKGKPKIKEGRTINA